jgi:carbon storage regulator
MLTLTRRVGETLIIELPDGQEIRVTVTGLNGSQVRLGTEAPREILVSREEIRDKLSA